MGKSLSELSFDLADLRGQIEAKEDELTALTTRELALEKQIIELMDKEDIRRFNQKGIGTVYQRTSVYAHIKETNRDAAYQWLRENGYDDAVIEYVHPQRLKAIVKELLESNLEVPQEIGHHLETDLSIRKE